MTKDLSQPLRPALVAYQARRAWRQAIGLAVAAVLFIGLTAGGVWMIVASHLQYPGRPEAWIGTAFGTMFAMLGVTVVGTSVEVLRRIRRWSMQATPLLRLDDAGIAGDDGVAVPWDAVARIELHTKAPAPRGTNRLAQLDPAHQLSLAVKRGLDRTAGPWSGLRDGRRWVRVMLQDGTDRWHDLTLPVGPARFAAIAVAIGEHAEHHGAPCTLVRN